EGRRAPADNHDFLLRLKGFRQPLALVGECPPDFGERLRTADKAGYPAIIAEIGRRQQNFHLFTGFRFAEFVNVRPGAVTRLAIEGVAGDANDVRTGRRTMPSEAESVRQLERAVKPGDKPLFGAKISRPDNLPFLARAGSNPLGLNPSSD